MCQTKKNHHERSGGGSKGELWNGKTAGGFGATEHESAIKGCSDERPSAFLVTH